MLGKSWKHLHILYNIYKMRKTDDRDSNEMLVSKNYNCPKKGVYPV